MGWTHISLVVSFLFVSRTKISSRHFRLSDYSRMSSGLIDNATYSVGLSRLELGAVSLPGFVRGLLEDDLVPNLVRHV